MDEPADLKDPKTWLALAELKLGHAKKIFEIGLYDDAISRAYYAMYFAAKAVLLSEGLDLHKHSAAIAKFRELFVITGRVEDKYLHYLGQAQSARESSNYSPHIAANRQDAKEILAKADTFLVKMNELLK